MTETNIDIISQYITDGKVIIYPTETVWGIGCSPYNDKVIKRLYKIKNRAENKPLLLLVNSVEMVLKHAPHLNKEEVNQLQLAHPTSVILNNIIGLPFLPKGPNSSIAFRITKHLTCQKIITKTGQPLISTSANFAGEKEASTYKELSKELLKLADYVWEDSINEENKNTKRTIKPSRIVQVIEGKVVTLRE